MIVLGLCVLLFALFFVAMDTPLDDGYHVQKVRSALRYEERYIFYGSALLTFPLVWLGNNIIEPFWVFDSVIFGNFRLTYVVGILFAIFLGPLWIRTLQNASGRKTQLIRSGGIFLAATLGIGLGGATLIGIHPNMAAIDENFGYYLTVAFSGIQQHQAVLGLSIPILESPLRNLREQLGPAIRYTWDIYVNNAEITVFGGSFAFIGGLVGGLGIPLAMIGGVKIGLILAAYLGLFLRYVITTGNPLFGPFIAFGAAISLHTIPEVLATVSAQTGMGVAGMGSTKGSDRAWLGAKIVLVSVVGFLGFASFIEVFLSPVLAEPLIGYLTVSGEIVPYNMGLGRYLVAAGSTLVAFVVAGEVSIRSVRTTVGLLEDYV
ncbi:MULTISPECIES: hypothetical protein [Haloarcula]|uniref:hypothetical protein n=1 Tax=Haloarcula TaxID=2237 RepID=UPI0023E8EB1A|nr:hypothetical protein [Halomicroarcula sp. SHR3]